MELIVTRADNSNYNLPSENSKIVSAVQTRTLMGEDTVAMTVHSVGYINFLIGDWIEVFGRQYTLNTLGEPRRIGENTFEYNLVFEGVNYELTKVVYRSADYSGFNPTSDFPLTGTAESFLTVLQYNLDRAFGQGVWAIGSFPPTEAKTLSFTSENCLMALNRVCSEFGLEYEIKIIGGVKTINLGAVGDTLPLTLEYGKGKGLYSLTRTNVDSKNIVTRLYVEGSDRNVKAGYRDNALRLRIASNAESYIDSASAASFGIIEGSKIFDDIFPHREGTVSAINESDVLEFTDSSMDFDLAEADSNGTKWLIAGQSAKIHFNTGALAGYEFELTSYNHATKTFKIKPFKDERGLQFPNPDSAAFQIKTGDKYVILDIIMPDAYIQAAEAELLARAQEYLSQNDQPRVEYSLDLDRFFLKSMFSGPGFEVNFLDAGDYLHIKDSKIGVDKEVRVKTFTRDVLDPWVYQVSLSDVIEPTRIELLLADTLETKKAARQSKLFDPARTRRNWRDVEEVAGMVDTLRAEVALIGSPEGQFQVDSFFEVNKGGNPDSFGATAGVLAHDAFEGDAGSVWNIGAFDVALSNSGAYYLYAKCSKVNAGAVFTVSLTKIGVEDVPGYYHFPVGLISSKRDNSRTLTTTYGYTLISGNNISTGIIKNTVSGIEINLQTGEIRGNFKFTSGASVEESIQEQIDAIQVGGRNLIPNSIGLLRGLTVYGASGYAKENVEGGVKLTFDAGDTVRGVSREYVNNSSVLSGVEISGFVTTSMIIESDEPFSGFRVSFFTSSLGHLVVNGTVTEIAPNKYKCVATTELTEPRTGVRSVDFNLTANANCTYLTVRNLKLELGNKATDWSPAPEDVTAEIATAKQEALTAAGNAQNTANTANAAVGNLNTYVDGAFKDGVIDAAEAKAIEKYKNTLNEAMAKAESSYSKVYTNSYLSGTAKTTLQNAKINLWGQRDTLISAINTAISGGTTTSSQKAAVDSAFGTFNSLMSAFQNALEEANKAIQVKLDNISKGYADAVQVGGRNWLRGSSFLNGLGDVLEYATTLTVDPDSYIEGTKSYKGTGGANRGFRIGTSRIKLGVNYVFSFYGKGWDDYLPINVYSPGITVTSISASDVGGGWKRYVWNIMAPVSGIIYFRANGNSSAYAETFYICAPKLEIGNRATDWTPAPEDVPSSLEYLAKAIQDGSTDIEGGLVTTNVLMVKDTNGAVRGGMSGLKEDNVGFWAGGTYQDALNNDAKVIFRKDGSGQLAGGLIKFLENANVQVGDIEVDANGTLLVREGSADRVMITKGNITTLAGIAASTQDDVYSHGGANVSSLGTTTVVLTGNITVMNPLSYVTVTGMLSTKITRPTSGASFGAYTLIKVSLVRWDDMSVAKTFTVQWGHPSGSGEKSFSAPLSMGGAPVELAGVYHIQVEFNHVVQGPSTGFEFYSVASGFSTHVVYDGAKRITEIGKNGVGILADKNNYSFFGVEGGVYKVVEKTTGVYDRPGVLLAGYVSSGGAMSSYWGAKYRSGSYREGNNIYRIHHSIGHTNYFVSLTPALDARMWVIEKLNNYVRVQASVASLAFDFVIFGNNQ